jgi:hypothetical protein
MPSISKSWQSDRRTFPGPGGVLAMVVELGEIGLRRKSEITCLTIFAKKSFVSVTCVPMETVEIPYGSTGTKSADEVVERILCGGGHRNGCVEDVGIKRFRDSPVSVVDPSAALRVRKWGCGCMSGDDPIPTHGIS